MSGRQQVCERGVERRAVNGDARVGWLTKTAERRSKMSGIMRQERDDEIHEIDGGTTNFQSELKIRMKRIEEREENLEGFIRAIPDAENIIHVAFPETNVRHGMLTKKFLFQILQRRQRIAHC